MRTWSYFSSVWGCGKKFNPELFFIVYIKRLVKNSFYCLIWNFRMRKINGCHKSTGRGKIMIFFTEPSSFLIFIVYWYLEVGTTIKKWRTLIDVGFRTDIREIYVSRSMNRTLQFCKKWHSSFGRYSHYFVIEFLKCTHWRWKKSKNSISGWLICKNVYDILHTAVFLMWWLVDSRVFGSFVLTLMATFSSFFQKYILP